MVRTPLEREIRRLIEVAGPMPVARYMSLCLTHPQHGYYVTRDPFGVNGDFTTSPEISQIFGELLGLWAMSVWRMLGEPEVVRLIELGPGRGTMMSDALRVTRMLPKFQSALSVHLVEVSPTMEKAQREILSDVELPIAWHRDLIEVPEGPTIILANEYLDALPVHQVVKQATGWHERVIGLDADGEFTLGVTAEPVPHFDRLLPKSIKSAPDGAIFEWRDDLPALDIGRRVVKDGAALVIDYGHTQSDVGETLQAMKAHEFVHPLSEPGLIDLTAHVDFQRLAQAAENVGAAVQGPVTQGRFLTALGIDARAERLRMNATFEQAQDIDAAVARLTETGSVGMGELFKVMAICDPKLGPLPGLVSE